MTGNLFLDPIIPVFFIYGLAFYTMGLVVAFEAGAHISDPPMSRSLLVLAGFGLIHGLHEWFEMFLIIANSMGLPRPGPALDIVRLAVLAVSFILLALFGSSVLNRQHHNRSPYLSPLVLFGLSALGFGVLLWRFGGQWDCLICAADAWVRYSLGMVGGLLAAGGLLAGARTFQQEGKLTVARGWTMAGLALGIYGVIGQSVPNPSSLFPSTVWNTEVFEALLGFPVQLLRAGAATVTTIGLIGALRALELDRQRAYTAARRRAAEELQRREALQKELLRRMVSAQEEERARIARELHDHTGQTLTALNYRVTALRNAVEGQQPVTMETVTALRALAKEALADLRQLVTDLRPAQLDDLGLVAALHWLRDQMRRSFNLNVIVSIEGRKTRLPGAVETALFRITQEALTNVVKHATVDTARVRLAFEDTQVCLEIIDHGAGFDPALINLSSTSVPEDLLAWGIIGMQERAAALDGDLRLASSPGVGTTVHATIPITGDNNGQ